MGFSDIDWWGENPARNNNPCQTLVSTRALDGIIQWISKVHNSHPQKLGNSNIQLSWNFDHFEFEGMRWAALLLLVASGLGGPLLTFKDYAEPLDPAEVCCWFWFYRFVVLIIMITIIIIITIVIFSILRPRGSSSRGLSEVMRPSFRWKSKPKMATNVSAQQEALAGRGSWSSTRPTATLFCLLQRWIVVFRIRIADTTAKLQLKVQLDK